MSDIDTDSFYECDSSPISISISVPLDLERARLSLDFSTASESPASSTPSLHPVKDNGTHKINLQVVKPDGGSSGGKVFELSEFEKAILREAWRLMQVHGEDILLGAVMEAEEKVVRMEDEDHPDAVEGASAAPDGAEQTGVDDVPDLDVSRWSVEQLATLRQPQIDLNDATPEDYGAEKERIETSARAYGRKKIDEERELRKLRVNAGVGLKRRDELASLWNNTVKEEMAKARAEQPALPLRQRIHDYKFLGIVRRNAMKMSIVSAGEKGWKKMSAGGQAAGEFVETHGPTIVKVGGLVAETVLTVAEHIPA